MGRPKKEYVLMERVQTLMGANCIKVEMVISEGKFCALVNALEDHKTAVAADLLRMFQQKSED